MEQLLCYRENVDTFPCMSQYMEQLLCYGEFMEFFLEGGRSRTGKALQPKGGLLSVIMDSLNNGMLINPLDTIKFCNFTKNPFCHTYWYVDNIFFFNTKYFL